MMPVIRRVQAKSDFSVKIEWQDGETSVVSFHNTIAKGGRFAQLGDPDFFARVELGEDGTPSYVLENLILGQTRFGIEPTLMLQWRNLKWLRNKSS